MAPSLTGQIAAEVEAKRVARASVLSEIGVTLNDLPEELYPEEVWNTKVGAVWDLVLTRHGAGQPRYISGARERAHGRL